MTATVRIVRLNGSGPTATDITSINTVVNIVDSHQSTAIGSASPIPIPAIGPNLSYWCVTRLNVTVAPSGTINNIRWYADGANNFGTGISCNGDTASSYTQATSAVALNDTNYPTLSVATAASVFAFTSGSPKSVTGSTSITGQFGHMFVYQMVIANTAEPGATGQETFTWAYDET